MRRITRVFAIGLVGLFFLVLGTGLAWFGKKSVIKMWAWEKLTLKNGSEAMMRWTRQSHPISMKVYIFNVTNPEEVSEGEFPILKEVGPYVYEESREKVNIEQLENYTLSYRLRNIIKFKKSLSGGLRESDTVTIPNVPLAGAILSVYETVPEFVGLLNDIWQLFYPGQRNIFIKTSVKEILFDGITIDCTSKVTEVYVACRGLESRKSYTVRKEGKNFKFSFFYGKNGTSPETYQVNQGILDLKKSAQFVGVNYSPSIRTWKNHYCDMINGSDGAQFPVMVDKTEKLYIFEKELCRSLYAEFEKEVIEKGVTLYKFSNTESLFASPEENPNNKCFCRSPLSLRDIVQPEEEAKTEKDGNDSKICLQDGTLPLLPCVGAPIVASFPHFYLGDRTYVNYSGLNPKKELHETFAHVEPNSGVTILGFKRIQFNVELKRISDVQIMSNLIDGLFPILWVEEKTELPLELFKLLRYTLFKKKVLERGTFVLIGMGIFLMISAYIARLISDRKRRRTTKTDAYPHGTGTHLGFWQKSNPMVVPRNFDALKNTVVQKEFQKKLFLP